jgi:hypothetical protein
LIGCGDNDQIVVVTRERHEIRARFDLIERLHRRRRRTRQQSLREERVRKEDETQEHGKSIADGFHGCFKLAQGLVAAAAGPWGPMSVPDPLVVIVW